MYHIVVFDIGKTNKKIVVYSSELELISKDSVQIPEKEAYVDGRKLYCDDIEGIKTWLFEKLASLFSDRKYNIKVISTTTHGATIVWLGERGELLLPVISYTNEIENETREKFYKLFGSAEELYLETATPPYGQLLAVALQIFYVKEKFTEKFNNAKHILFLPQYISYLLTGKTLNEITSIGCHTYLYSFKEKKLSSVARKLNICRKLGCKIYSPFAIAGRISEKILREHKNFDKSCKVSCGIHDSNASLLPYLINEESGKFVLASTGTWCVFMYPGSEFYLSREDLYKDTLYYIDAFGRPVRASRVKGGEEHDHYAKLIEKRFSVDPRTMELVAAVFKKILSEGKTFVIPSLTQGCGQFPFSKPRIVGEKNFYRSAEIAYHTLCLSVAIQSYYAIQQAVGKDEGKKIDIYVEGGFRNNKVYLGMLSVLFPENDVYVTDIEEATSLGAALCGKCAYENISTDKMKEILPGMVKIKKVLVPKVSIPQREIMVKRYIAAFERYCSGKKV
jgi:sugar (pentulose or hexulose) kinase